MGKAHEGNQLCPSREGGSESLIAHWITPSRCQTRQRELYHKCFTCVHRNGYVPVPVAGAEPVERAQPETTGSVSG